MKFATLCLIASFFAVLAHGSASISMGTSATDVIDCGNASAISGLTEYTVIMHVNATTQTGSRRFWLKGSPGEKSNVWRGVDSNDFSFFQKRSVTSASNATAQNFTVGTQYVFAWSYEDTSGSSIFYKTNTSSFVAPTLLAGNPIIGSGTIGDDSTTNLFIGNNASLSAPFQGNISAVAYYNKKLKYDEQKEQIYSFTPTTNTVLVIRPNGTGNYLDESGNGNVCAPSGVAASNVGGQTFYQMGALP